MSPEPRAADELGRRGATLIELLIGMSILVLILGAILGLHLQGVKLYQDVAASDWATFEAATGVHFLEQDIQQCYRVVGRYTDRIYLSRPLLVWSADQNCYLPDQPLAHGDIVRYYLSDHTGTLGVEGDCLWRAVRPQGGAAFVVDPQPLADGIEKLQFIYHMLPAPRDSSVKTVDLLVRATCKEGGATRTRTHTAQITLRNAYYGPVTGESGEYQEE